MQPPRQSPVPSLLLAAVLALSAAPAATGQAPRSIITVAVAANGSTPARGEMYWIDHEKNNMTKITTPAIFDTDRPNCILMTSPVTGYIGTNPTSSTATGNIYSFSLAGNSVVLGNNGQPLNTTATAGNNIAQLAILGSGSGTRIWFVSQTGTAIGTLQSIPQGGGAVVAEYDVSTLPSTLLANAMTAALNKIYIGTWNLSAAAAGEIIEFDTTSKQARKLRDLPFSQYKGGAGTSTVGFGCLNMHTLPNLDIAVLGLYGDKVEINPFTNQIVSHTFHGPRTSPTAANSVNSGYYDPTTNDWVIGTRRGSVERWVEEGTAVGIVTGIGTHPTPTGNSVNGVHHFPVAKNSDLAYGPGCPVTSTGLTPTDVAAGAAVPGNGGFALALWNGPPNQSYVLALGLLRVDVPLGNPGCRLLVSPVMLIGGTLSAAGGASIPAPLPNGLPVGTTVHRQWGCNAGVGGLVLSNARTIKIQ